MLKTKKDIIPYLDKFEDDTLFEIKKPREKTIRSQALNKYRWAVAVTIISKEFWNNELMTHGMLKTMFWLWTTTDLTNDEFCFLIKSTIELFNDKYNLRIPLPNEDKEFESLVKYIF